jgi:uncharacterized protein (DUF1778 family)
VVSLIVAHCAERFPATAAYDGKTTLRDVPRAAVHEGRTVTQFVLDALQAKASRSGAPHHRRLRLA